MRATLSRARASVALMLVLLVGIEGMWARPARAQVGADKLANFAISAENEMASYLNRCLALPAAEQTIAQTGVKFFLRGALGWVGLALTAYQVQQLVLQVRDAYWGAIGFHPDMVTVPEGAPGLPFGISHGPDGWWAITAAAGASQSVQWYGSWRNMGAGWLYSDGDSGDHSDYITDYLQPGTYGNVTLIQRGNGGGSWNYTVELPIYQRPPDSDTGFWQQGLGHPRAREAIRNGVQGAQDSGANPAGLDAPAIYQNPDGTVGTSATGDPPPGDNGLEGPEGVPTPAPSTQPSPQPSAEPSAEPSTQPSAEPSAQPSEPPFNPPPDLDNPEAPNFWVHFYNGVKDKFPLDLVGDVASVPGAAEQDFKVTMFGQAFDLNFIKPLFVGINAVAVIGMVIWALVAL